jgi:glycosyltransferase involved in cell wall biosynthesis
MTTEMKRFNVNILLSSYNGERFIEAQIDSLLKQSFESISIFIRDDGSTDNTVSKIRPYLTRHSNIHLTTGKNLGVIGSFIELLNHAPDGKNELYAFCDQDDIWLPDKIERAAVQLSNQSSPAHSLYCSRLEYVDENLNHLGYTLIPKVLGFNNAVVENIAVGCTVVFGTSIKEYMLRASPDLMMMHDWWAYLTASAFGEIIYDNKPTISYRQHGNNVTAFEPGLVKIKARFKGLISRLRSKQHTGLDSLNQAINFKDTYKELSKEHCDIINHLVELRGPHKLIARIRYVLNPEVIRTNPVENWSLKPMIIFGWH